MPGNNPSLRKTDLQVENKQLESPLATKSASETFLEVKVKKEETGQDSVVVF